MEGVSRGLSCKHIIPACVRGVVRMIRRLGPAWTTQDRVSYKSGRERGVCEGDRACGKLSKNKLKLQKK